MRYEEDYYPIEWVDHVEDAEGNVIQQGTPVSQKQLNRIESGIQTSLGPAVAVMMQTLQFVQKLNQEHEKLERQKIKQGEVTVSEGSYIAVALDGYIQYDAPNYQVFTEIVAGDPAFVGEVEVYDKTSNGFKIKYSGSETEATIRWTLINFDIK